MYTRRCSRVRQPRAEALFGSVTNSPTSSTVAWLTTSMFSAGGTSTASSTTLHRRSGSSNHCCDGAAPSDPVGGTTVGIPGRRGGRSMKGEVRAR
jgi:hypothetical protein